MYNTYKIIYNIYSTRKNMYMLLCNDKMRAATFSFHPFSFRKSKDDQSKLDTGQT